MMEMVAEKAVEAFLAVVFEKLLEQLASPELRKNSIASKLKELDGKLREVRLLLVDAEDRQLKEKEVKKWLDELKHVVLRAEDLVETVGNSKKEKKSKTKAVVRAIKSVYHSLANTVQGEIDLILTDLDTLLREAMVLELKHIKSSADPSRRSSPPIIAPLREACHVYGREAEKEEILKMLLSEEDKMMVLPIVGMGGLGKTTLAQLVYDDKQVEENVFFPKAWVTVSTEFDFCKIVKELLQKVDGGSSSDPNELQRLLKEVVRGKRFLFVLDDVWEDDYRKWDLLNNIFTAGDQRSRVIVTTRSRDVGSMVKTGPIYELQEVQKDECWRIFVHHAFNGDMDADQELQVIGRRIVDKCKGHPLAIVCIGGILRSERNPQKWEDILNSDLGDWSTVMENGVLSSLWLSYRSLPSALKQCFAYCYLFPQDHEFNKKEMILLWMAEGFILIPSNEKGKSMEKVGEEYFEYLISRSLFQRSNSDNSNMYVVHDMVHDLAAFVYRKFCSSICEDDDLKNVTIRTRHLTYMKDVSSDNLLISLSTSKHLRTLMHIQAYHIRLRVEEIALKVRSLRVLTISLELPVLHHSIGDLKMLRYLNLLGFDIQELPDSICSLFHLQTLILTKCYKLTKLPTDLPKKLSKLRHLDTSESGLREMPPKMGSLKELRILTDFVVGEGHGSGCSTLKELGELHHLGGILRISNLQNVDNLEDVQMANLRDKAEVKELVLSWGNDTSNKAEAVDVLDALQPHKNLEKLEVLNYPGSSFPKWIGDTSFSKLVYVLLGECRSSVMPPLGRLQSLEELHVRSLSGVEKIGNEFLYGNDTKSSSIAPFPSLEALSFMSMPSWKEWSFDGNQSVCFPRLKTLYLYDCPELECIIKEDDTAEMGSTKLHHHCPSLSQLMISDCNLLERRYREDKGDHWYYISHIPEVFITGNTTDELEREEEERSESEEEVPEIHKTGSTTDELKWEEDQTSQGEEDFE